MCNVLQGRMVTGHQIFALQRLETQGNVFKYMCGEVRVSGESPMCESHMRMLCSFQEYLTNR